MGLSDDQIKAMIHKNITRCIKNHATKVFECSNKKLNSWTQVVQTLRIQTCPVTRLVVCWAKFSATPRATVQSCCLAVLNQLRASCLLITTPPSWFGMDASISCSATPLKLTCSRPLKPPATHPRPALHQAYNYRSPCSLGRHLAQTC